MIALALAALVGTLSLSDGDSGRLVLSDGRSVKVRLAGMDAGEVYPFTRCRRYPTVPACSPIARRVAPVAATRARRIASYGPATCNPVGGRSYNRIVVRCYINGQDIGAQLVSEGLAISEPNYKDPYRREEEEARRKKIGVWAR